MFDYKYQIQLVIILNKNPEKSNKMEIVRLSFVNNM